MNGAPTALRISRPALAGILLTAIAVTALDDAFVTYEAAREMRLGVHRAILDHTATAPDRYRVLVPAVVELVIRALARFMPYTTAFDTAYAAFYIAGFFLIAWTLYLYLRVWFTEPQALIGALAAVSTLRLTMQEYTVYSILEPSFFALGLLLAYRQRRGWLAVVVLLASLNRETAVFLPLAYAVTTPVTRRNAATTAGLFAIWAVVFAGLRLAAGDAYRHWTIDTIWAWNRYPAHLALAVQNIVLLLGAFWVFAALGLTRSPAFIRRSALVIPPYLATYLIWGVWSEVRLLTSLYPIVFSLALCYLFRPRPAPAPASGPAFGRPIVAALILISVAGLNAYHYSFLVPKAAVRREMHQAVIDRTAPAPERFRVLAPYTVQAIARPASALMPPEKALGRVYAVFYLAALAGLLIALFSYLALWFSREAAMIGALLVADTIHIALRQGEYIALAPIPAPAIFAPHSMLEPLLLTAVLILIVQRRWAWLPRLTAVAALNSEAALVIPLLALAVGEREGRRAAMRCAAAAGVVLVGLRLWIGGPWAPMVLETWRANQAHIADAVLNVGLFLGAGWILAARGISRVPVFLRRVALCVPVIAAAVAVWGLWWDVRLLMPLYPLVMPLVLAGLGAAVAPSYQGAGETDVTSNTPAVPSSHTLAAPARFNAPTMAPFATT